MIESARSALEEARQQLGLACEHVRQCCQLYGEDRVTRGLPVDRDWAVIPLCRALRAIVDELEELHQSVAALEARLPAQTAWPVAGLVKSPPTEP